MVAKSLTFIPRAFWRRKLGKLFPQKATGQESFWRPGIVRTVAFATFGLVALLTPAVAFAIEWHVVSVSSGTTTTSRHFSDSDYCYTTNYPYQWNHSLAFSVNTNTSTRVLTITYLDFYNGGTSPDPVYPHSPPIDYVWSHDSWAYGKAGTAYQFGTLGSFSGKPFDTYDITLWLYRDFAYSSGGLVTVETRFGEATGGGGTSYLCDALSELYFDPPN